MKKRDSILFSLPVTAATLIAAFAYFLYWQINKFEESYLHDAQSNLAKEAELAGAVIIPALKSQDLPQILQFFQTLKGQNLRLTLIDAAGKVLADTEEDSEIFDNHKNRREVQSASQGTPATSIRYSTSLNQRMIYHAIPLDCNGERFVLRGAIPTVEVGRVIDIFRLNMFFALLFGAEIVLFMTIYIVRKVRKPMIDLQQSVKDIASGNLERAIHIPEGDIIHELAIDIAKMAEQLKHQLAQVTFERNEREALFNTMSEGVLLFADDGFLIRANNSAAKLLHFDKEKPFQLNRCHIPELIQESQRTLNNNEAFEKEFCFDWDGQSVSLWIRGLALGRDGEKRLLLTITDLTSLRKLEACRADYIANVSHELKTPLTCIIGATEALEETTVLENRGKLISMLKKNAERLNNLIKDILSLAHLEKIDFPKQDLQKVMLDAIVENVVAVEQERAISRGFELLIAENKPLTVLGEANLLEQAMINLIENALRYSNGKTITVGVSQEAENAVITVKDDGIGIAPEHHKRLFERFYRVDKSRSRELGGTGLGLAIVKHIAMIHGGKVEVVSQVNAGAEFRILIPM